MSNVAKSVVVESVVVETEIANTEGFERPKGADGKYRTVLSVSRETDVRKGIVTARDSFDAAKAAKKAQRILMQLAYARATGGEIKPEWEAEERRIDAL